MSQSPPSLPTLPAQPAPTPAHPTATEVLDLLSKPRTAPYQVTFRPSSDDEHLGCYMWAQAVSASFHPLLGFAEVVLRNAIHRSLSLQLSGQSSDSFAWYDRAMPNSVPLHGKSLAKVEELLCSGTPPIRRAIQPTPDAVIASLSFGFWPNVMEGLSMRFAPRTFTDVFPHHPNSKPKHWSYQPNQRPVVDRLKRLQELRNRVCHFEPVWKPHWLGVASTNTHWSAAVHALRQLRDDVIELLGWCSPKAMAAYNTSFGANWLGRMCTTNGVMAFMVDHGACARLPLFTASAAPAATPAPGQASAA